MYAEYARITSAQKARAAGARAYYSTTTDPTIRMLRIRHPETLSMGNKL